MWAKEYGLNLERCNKRKHYEYALDYITYKTLKISARYRQYSKFYSTHRDRRNSIDEGILKTLVAKLAIDHSHITRKIRQVLVYLSYGIYEQGREDRFEVSVQNTVTSMVKQVMETELNKNEKDIPHRIIYSFDDLVPPPIYDVDIKLVDISSNTDGIGFETLSSGEKQQVFTISSILYHLSNIQSIFDDENKERITYSHCNVILEELELYFHPELQKNLVKYLLDGIRQMHFKKIEAINICMVTHSPFILSDIQSKNILALDKDGNMKSGLCTFGANIHDLLKTSFLHDSVIGDYAQWIINRIIILLQVYQCINDNIWRHPITKEYLFLRPYLDYVPEKGRKNSVSFNSSLIKKDYPPEHLFSLIMTIDEPIIRSALLDEYESVFGDLSAAQKIDELKKRIEFLEHDLHKS
jgi:predicted ATP-binding protein involved in virulence